MIALLWHRISIAPDLEAFANESRHDQADRVSRSACQLV